MLLQVALLTIAVFVSAIIKRSPVGEPKGRVWRLYKLPYISSTLEHVLGARYVLVRAAKDGSVECI